MKKADRQKVFDKFDGHCAYCGCVLEKGWHVDELLPVKRNYKWNSTKTRYIPDGTFEHPENFNLDNQMPACASCNINKHSMSLEEFRKLISGFMSHLNNLNTQYKIAKRYGLVIENIKPIVFYFEQIKNNQI